MGATERDEWLRAAWRVLAARGIAAERLVFVDEMGTNTSLHPPYAWSPRGERARCSVPRNRGPNTTLLASITAEGMGPCLAVEGATSSTVFEAYLAKVLVPSLRRARVVVMDNLSAHKGERVRELIESAGWELLYLPPYSPDYNPIEGAFSKVKGLLRKAQAKSREALWWRLWVGLSMRSVSKMQDVSSSTADTLLWFNRFDRRCNGSLLKAEMLGHMGQNDREDEPRGRQNRLEKCHRAPLL